MIESMRPGLRKMVHERATFLRNILLPEQRKALTKFLQAQEGIWETTDEAVGATTSDGIAAGFSFMQRGKASKSVAFDEIPGFKSYAPQSGQIFGILKQMKE